jgi:hypothetical protein
LSSCEALQALHDVEKNDIETWGWIKTAQYRVENPQLALDNLEVEPPFAHAADLELDPCNVPVDAVLLHVMNLDEVPPIKANQDQD